MHVLQLLLRQISLVLLQRKVRMRLVLVLIGNVLPLDLEAADGTGDNFGVGAATFGAEAVCLLFVLRHDRALFPLIRRIS